MSKLKYFDGTNWNIVNGQITGDTLPIGAIVPYGSSTAPTGWLVCDGLAVSRTTYSELFAIIGTSYGAGDGSTTFNLPNLKGRVAVGQDTSDTSFDTMGEKGGSKTDNMSNTYAMLGYYENRILFNAKAQNVPVNRDMTCSSGNNISTQIGNATQIGGNVSTLQPYQVVCYIIKAKQSAGVVGNVLNEKSSSTTDTYSSDYIDGTEVWTNANPTSSFAGQDINKDLSSYSYLDIYCLRYVADDQSVLHFKVLLDSTYSTSQLFYVDYSNGVRSWNRTLSWTSSKITFGNNTINGSANNNGLIPYKIIGHK